MSFINYTTKEINCKVVYYGPSTCGKSTNLKYIYKKTNPEAKSQMVSLSNEDDSAIFFDFLPLALGEINGFKTRFHLYTIPGPNFFTSSRRLILKGVDGVVFVVDSQMDKIEANLESFEEFKINLREQGYDIDQLPFVLQYNKRDKPAVSSLVQLQQVFNPNNTIPEFESVAKEGVGVFETFKSIAKLIISDLKQKPLK